MKVADERAHYTCFGGDTGPYVVDFIDNKSKARLTRSFDSPYQARKFVNKIRHGKRCTIVFSPLFN